jgi:acyl dehydratase
MNKFKRGYGRYLEEFEVEDIYVHEPGKTITESDNNLFCLLTYNHHPVHLDREYAAKSQHGRILVVGSYVFSLVVGMSVIDTSGCAIANLEYEKVNHDAPVFIGDTISAQSEILDIKSSRSKPDRGIVYLETTAHNQHGDKVLTLRRRILIPRKQQK